MIPQENPFPEKEKGYDSRKPGWNGAKGFKGVNKGAKHRWKIGIQRAFVYFGFGPLVALSTDKPRTYKMQLYGFFWT